MKGKDFEERAWGRFDVVSRFTEDGKDIVIKKISVLPGKRLSYQSHTGRDEHWYIVSGTGYVIHEGERRELMVADSVDIKKGEKHRIGNESTMPLVFVEVATGMVDEDDIIRFEDDFGRVTS